MIADTLQRVSTKRQTADEKTGLERQDQNISNWLKQNPTYQQRHQIILKGQSAYKGTHLKGEFGAYLEKLRNGTLTPPDLLIVDDFSRLSRLPLDIGQDLVKELARLGITIVTASDGQKYEPESQKSLIGQLPILIRLEQAHAESERKSNMIRAAKKQRRDKALKDGGVLNFGNTPKWLVIEDNKYQLVPHRAEAIKLIFDLVLSGMSKGGVARELNKRTIKGWDRWGKDTIDKWDSSKVSRIISSKSVTGVHASRTWKRDGERATDYMWTVEANETGLEIKDAYPRVIFDEQFDAAQLKRDPHFQNLAKKPRATLNDGRSIIPNGTCSLCGGSMRYKKNSSGDQYTELICSNKAHGGSCSNSSINHKLAEEALLRLVFERVNFSFLFQDDEPNEFIKTRIQAVQSEIDALKARIKEKKGNVSSAVVLLLDDKESEIEQLKKEQRKKNINDYSDVINTWQDVLNGESKYRVKCTELFELITDKIEFESYRRGKKIIRVIGKDIGQIFAVIENRNIQCFTGTW